jgi:hypothetical protein
MFLQPVGGHLERELKRNSFKAGCLASKDDFHLFKGLIISSFCLIPAI